MKRILMTVGAASLLVLAGAATAEQQLTEAQMDNITASGVAFGDAFASAVGADAYAATYVNTLTVSLGPALPDPQFGSFDIVLAEVGVGAEAVTGGIAALGVSAGATVGDVVSDTVSYAASIASAPAKLATAMSSNSSISFSFTIPSTAVSSSYAGSVLTK